MPDGSRSMNRLMQSGKVSTFQIIFGIHQRLIVIRMKFLSQLLWWYVGVLASMRSWVTCISVKAPSMLKATYRFRSIMCCHQSNFFRDVHVYFRKKILSNIRSKRVLEWLPVSNWNGTLWSTEYDNGKPVQLNWYIKQEWGEKSYR